MICGGADSEPILESSGKRLERLAVFTSLWE
jgi:hypothetical protein